MRIYLCIKKLLSFSNRLIILVLLLQVFSFAQTKSNLEILYSLNDSLVHQIISELPNRNIPVELKLILGESFSVFSNHIQNEFIKRGYKLVKPVENELNMARINIVMENAGVEYGETGKDGWFGDYFIPRTVSIEGNYFNSLSAKGLKEFRISVVDTVIVANISELQNESFPFTKGEIPAEPFFSSLWEPVIAISVAAAAVLLFFSVRSK